MKQWLERYKHAWILLYAFLYIPWFSYLERTVTRDYYVIHTRLDDFIPFHEFFIIPYLAWFFYVSGVILYFFFKNKQDYYRLCIYLFTGMTLSLIVCTVFLKCLCLISFKRSANRMGAVKFTARSKSPITTVFRRSRRKKGPEKNCSKLVSPIHLLPNRPFTG